MGIERTACPKCGGEVQAGYMLAPGRGIFGNVALPNVAGWHADLPERGFWGFKLSSENHPVTVHRCRACGFLEFYAK